MNIGFSKFKKILFGILRIVWADISDFHTTPYQIKFTHQYMGVKCNLDFL